MSTYHNNTPWRLLFQKRSIFVNVGLTSNCDIITENNLNHKDPEANTFSDTIVVADSYADAVIIFDCKTMKAQKIGSYGSENGQFIWPESACFSLSGDLLVVEERNNRIQKIGLDGTYLGSFGSFGKPEGQFGRPVGVCVDDQNNIFVLDSKWRVQVFEPDSGILLRSFLAKVSGTITVPAAGIAILRISGNIIVWSHLSCELHIYTRDGNYIHTIQTSFSARWLVVDREDQLVTLGKSYGGDNCYYLCKTKYDTVYKVFVPSDHYLVGMQIGTKNAVYLLLKNLEGNYYIRVFH